MEWWRTIQLQGATAYGGMFCKAFFSCVDRGVVAASAEFACQCIALLLSQADESRSGVVL